MKINDIIQSARGDQTADLLLTNARMINVFSGRINHIDIAVAHGRIIGFGNYEADEIIDLENRYVAPGFIDAHVHIESSMTCVTEFVRAVLPNGTTTVVADPHEIANVLGIEGIEYMIRSAEEQPMNVRYALPSCVPATPMETAGATLTSEDLAPLLENERIVALAEVMNFPGVIYEDPDMLAKIARTRAVRKAIDGHAPGLSGPSLHAYLSTGIASDHECTSAEEALEKLEAGMHIMVREGTCARNLDTLFPVIDAGTAQRMMWCTDDRHPHELMESGHVDDIVRQAITKGLDPVTAIRMATLNPAQYFRMDDVGAIAPGRLADMVVFSDLNRPVAEMVFSRGVPVAESGQMLSQIQRPVPAEVRPSMNVKPRSLDFGIPVEGDYIRVIDLIPDQVVTGQSVENVSVSSGFAVSDTSRDILKIAVVERHRATGRVGLGFIRGFGLKKGALASSVAHDSHNIIVVGTSDEEMAVAVEKVISMGGGFAAVSGGKIRAFLELPIAGLMSDAPVPLVREQMDQIIDEARKMGTTLADPFMALGFVALPVIPDLKITDLGLVDVTQFKPVSLFVD